MNNCFRCFHSAFNCSLWRCSWSLLSKKELFKVRTMLWKKILDSAIFHSCSPDFDLNWTNFRIPSRDLLIQSSQSKHQNNVWNLFKINNKDTRRTKLGTDFTYCFGISIVDLEQVNADLILSTAQITVLISR